MQHDYECSLIKKYLFQHEILWILGTEDKKLLCWTEVLYKITGGLRTLKFLLV